MADRLEIALFGTCTVTVTGAAQIEIRGAKPRALFALLATAPLGRRSRRYLQQTLWGGAGYDAGHQNLRRALSDLRKLLGAGFDRFVHCTSQDIELDLEFVRFIGDPGDGAFLEDLQIHQPEFLAWLGSIRANPAQVEALYRAAPRISRAKPKVTVLPLRGLSPDAELGALGDWVAEEICRSLSRSNLLLVISHLSSRAVSHAPVTLPVLRDTLDVDFVLTGGLRRHGGQIIADMEFVDARSGAILWSRQIVKPAEHFPAEMHERLANVVQSIGRSMAELSIRAARSRPLPAMEDHELLIAGVSLMHRPQLRDFIQARGLLEELIARDPGSSDLHAWLGKWFVLCVFNGWSADREGDVARALACTSRALDLDPESSFGLTIDGFAHNNLKADLATAARRYDLALSVNPNEPLSWLLRGALSAFQDEGAAAIEETEMARRLSPIDPFGYFYDSLASTAHVAAGNYARALELADLSWAANDRHISTLRVRITALHCLGRGGEAREAAGELMRRQPGFRLEEYRRSHPSVQHKVGQKVLEAMSAAGIA